MSSGGYLAQCMLTCSFGHFGFCSVKNKGTIHWLLSCPVELWVGMCVFWIKNLFCKNRNSLSQDSDNIAYIIFDLKVYKLQTTLKNQWRTICCYEDNYPLPGLPTGSQWGKGWDSQRPLLEQDCEGCKRKLQPRVWYTKTQYRVWQMHNESWGLQVRICGNMQLWVWRQE